MHFPTILRPSNPRWWDDVADGNQLVLIDVLQGWIGNLHLHQWWMDIIINDQSWYTKLFAINWGEYNLLGRSKPHGVRRGVLLGSNIKMVWFKCHRPFVVAMEYVGALEAEGQLEILTQCPFHSNPDQITPTSYRVMNVLPSSQYNGHNLSSSQLCISGGEESRWLVWRRRVTYVVYCRIVLEIVPLFLVFCGFWCAAQMENYTWTH